MKEAIKRRSIRVAGMDGTGCEAQIRSSLSRLPGMKQVKASASGEVHVEYDLLKVRLERIEEAIQSLGFDLKTGLFDRIKRSFIHETEQNEYDNLVAPQRPCCSDPKL